MVADCVVNLSPNWSIILRVWAKLGVPTHEPLSARAAHVPNEMAATAVIVMIVFCTS
jgi:hypothetical protein